MKFFVMISLLTFSLVPLSALAKEVLSLYVPPGYAELPPYKEAIDFIIKVVNESGYDVRTVEAPRKNGPSLVNAGHIDALPLHSLEDGAGDPNIVNSSFPIAFTISRVLWMKNNKSFQESHLEKFHGAMILNSSAIKTEAHHRKLALLEVDRGYAELIKMLTSKGVDYIVVPEEIIQGFFDAQPDLNKSVSISAKAFVKTPLYFAVNKKNKTALKRIEKQFRKDLSENVDQFKYIKNSLNTHP